VLVGSHRLDGSNYATNEPMTFPVNIQFRQALASQEYLNVFVGKTRLLESTNRSNNVIDSIDDGRHFVGGLPLKAFGMGIRIHVGSHSIPSNTRKWLTFSL
jgi:hypothetical protein